MDQELFKNIKEYIDSLPSQYKIQLYRQCTYVSDDQKENYVRKAMQNYLKQYKDQNYLNLEFNTTIGSVNCSEIFFCKNDEYYGLGLKFNERILLCSSNGSSAKRSFKLNSNNIYELDSNYCLGHIDQDIIDNSLEFLNHIDINQFKSFIKNIEYEYDYYPLIKVENVCNTIMGIRKFRESILSILPKDVVKLIVKEVWLSRKDIKAWIYHKE